MKRRIPMSRAEQTKELLIATRYLAAARSELSDYPCKTDLIGRALADQVQRMERILELVEQGIPFGVGRNK